MGAFVLVALIAIGIGFGWHKLRGKLGMAKSAKTWIGPAIVVAVAILLMWGAHVGR